MAMAERIITSVSEIAHAVAKRLVTVSDIGDSTFVNLPLIYPSGSFVTVKIDQTSGGIRVSDNGFAYRELESVGRQRSFGLTAHSVAEVQELETNRRCVFVEVPPEQLMGAICDVGIASWQIADKVFSKIAEEDEEDIEEHLKERLVCLFGADHTMTEDKIIGASTSEWEVSALVRFPDHLTVFHAVSNHPNSVFKASTAFHDLAALDSPPKLVAVVRNKKLLGPKLGLLSQAGRVIEDEQSDDVYRRAAA